MNGSQKRRIYPPMDGLGWMPNGSERDSSGEEQQEERCHMRIGGK